MTAAASLEALANETARTALSECAAIRTALGVATPAEALALIFITDADEVLSHPYCIISSEAGGGERIGDAHYYTYAITAELWFKPLGEAGDDDFVQARNVEDVRRQIWDQKLADTLAFEIDVAPEISISLRGDDQDDGEADTMGITIIMTLGAYA